MPTRYLKPGIRDSERINALTAEAEVFYYRLIVTVDDFGRADARPAMLKAACFPVRDSASTKKCGDWLRELSSAGLIDCYSVDGKPYLQMQKWDNQPRARDSKFPAPSDACIQLHADVCNPRTVLPGTGTGTGTGTENREPQTENRNREPQTETEIPPGSSPRTAKRRTVVSSEAWSAYATAYRERYGADPVRNAKVNGQLSQLVARLGAEEAPGVARFYLSNRNALYVNAKHCTDLLLRDAEKLRTEWVTGNVTHLRDASEADRLGSQGAMWARVGDKLRAKGIIE